MDSSHSKYDPIIEECEKTVQKVFTHYESRCLEMDERKWGEEKCIRYLRFIMFVRLNKTLTGKKI